MKNGGSCGFARDDKDSILNAMVERLANQAETEFDIDN